MTTIAIDQSLTMAADSQATVCDRRVQQPVTKIFQTNGYTIGIAGRYSEALVFIEALEDALERVKLQESTYIPIEQGVIEEMDNFHALMITPEGGILEYEGSRFTIPVEAPIAIGTGSDYALAAMECGKNAIEAVEVAIKFDVYSGGEVQFASIPEPEQVPSREDWEKKPKREILDEIFGKNDEQQKPLPRSGT